LTCPLKETLGLPTFCVICMRNPKPSACDENHERGKHCLCHAHRQHEDKVMEFAKEMLMKTAITHPEGDFSFVTRKIPLKGEE